MILKKNTTPNLLWSMLQIFVIIGLISETCLASASPPLLSNVMPGVGALTSYHFISDISFQKVSSSTQSFPSSAQNTSTFDSVLYNHQHSLQLQINRYPQIAFWTTPSVLDADSDGLLTLKFRAINSTFLMVLENKKDFLHPKATLNIQRANSSTHKTTLFTKNLYKGHVYEYCPSIYARILADPDYTKNYPSLGWASILLHDTASLNNNPKFEGSFTKSGEHYIIKTIDSYERSKRLHDIDIASRNSRHADHQDSNMIMWKGSNIAQATLADPRAWSGLVDTTLYGNSSTMPATTGCGNPHLDWNKKGKHDWLKSITTQHHLYKRSTAGCPATQKILYMGVAADCTYTQAYNGASGALNQILSDWSTVSSIYESTFNIQLGIVEVNIQSDCTTANNQNWNQQCSANYQITQRLSDFSKWRGQQSSTAGLWHLMSTCSSGEIVGISWESQVCQTQATDQGGSVADGTAAAGHYVSGTGISTMMPNEFMVVAHEIGHGIGCIHDCDSSLCTDPSNAQDGTCCACGTGCDCQDKYLMNPAVDQRTTTFSPCSITDACKTLGLLGTCLQDPGSQAIISAQQCGNGIVEPGEQCDCGGTSLCNGDTCCNPTTCQYTAGSVCDPANDLCCQNCQPLKAGTVCRPASSTCQIQQTCPGATGKCPPAQNVPDLTACTTDNGVKAQCASGQCTSRDLQCAIRSGSLQITQQCQVFTDSCQLLCASSGSTDTCVQLNGYFINGTPCGYDGTCQNNTCAQSGTGKLVTWIKSNPIWATIIIILIVFVLAAIIYKIAERFCCQGWRSRRKARRLAAAQSGAAVPEANNVNSGFVDPSHVPPSRNGNPGYPGYSPPSYPMTVLRPSNPPQAPPSSGWVDPAQYNGNPATMPNWSRAHQT